MKAKRDNRISRQSSAGNSKGDRKLPLGGGPTLVLDTTEPYEVELRVTCE